MRQKDEYWNYQSALFISILDKGKEKLVHCTQYVNNIKQTFIFLLITVTSEKFKKKIPFCI